jgi:hypothetical protein
MSPRTVNLFWLWILFSIPKIRLSHYCTGCHILVCWMEEVCWMEALPPQRKTCTLTLVIFQCSELSSHESEREDQGLANHHAHDTSFCEFKNMIEIFSKSRIRTKAGMSFVWTGGECRKKFPHVHCKSWYPKTTFLVKMGSMGPIMGHHDHLL